MKVSKTSFLVLLIFVSVACNPKYREGYFPDEATPLAAANSTANDYNSDLKILFHDIFISFSSDRNTTGEGNFNLYTPQFSFSWDQEDGIFYVNEFAPSFRTEIMERKNWFDRSLSDFNEMGPHAFLTQKGEEALLFSRDDLGHFSINYLSKANVDPGNFGQGFTSRILDETSNEMYPSFLDQNYLKSNWDRKLNPEKMIFSSDRDGSFDIYEVDLAGKVSILAFLSEGNMKEGEKLSLNTTANDHAPFVYGNILVFASDRPGGFGGYDLYYSIYSNGNWTEPVNFGASVNTSSDEFRPVLSDHPNFKNLLMIFSSNRPGGLGGFDLYFVGIDKF